jgi:hypothetical protein
MKAVPKASASISMDQDIYQPSEPEATVTVQDTFANIDPLTAERIMVSVF